jgi:hypothetical protein
VVVLVVLDEVVDPVVVVLDEVLDPVVVLDAVVVLLVVDE